MTHYMNESILTSSSAANLEHKMLETVRTIPDFPKPGIMFKDITTLLLDPTLSSEIADELVRIAPIGVDAVVGIESRGFLFGLPLALRLGVPFVPLRKEGKLPADTERFEYELEYGSAVVEIHKDAIVKGQRVLIHDDLLATGGTALAAAELVKRMGGEVLGFSFLMSISALAGEEILQSETSDIAILARC